MYNWKPSDPGEQERIFEAYLEELESQGMSVREWANIECMKQSAMALELLTEYLQSARPSEKLLQSWPGHIFSTSEMLGTRYLYGRQGIGRSWQGEPYD